MRYTSQGLPFLSSPVAPTSSESPARVYRAGLGESGFGLA
jgi:hypothetical protein